MRPFMRQTPVYDVRQFSSVRLFHLGWYSWVSECDG